MYLRIWELIVSEKGRLVYLIHPPIGNSLPALLSLNTVIDGYEIRAAIIILLLRVYRIHERYALIAGRNIDNLVTLALLGLYGFVL